MGYRFEDRFLYLEIEGEKYKASVDIKKAREYGEKLKELSAENNKDEKAAASAIDSALDSVLGEGAAEKIFKGREFSLMEHLDVMLYVYSEITDFMNKRKQEYINVSAKAKSNKNRRNKYAR